MSRKNGTQEAQEAEAVRTTNDTLVKNLTNFRVCIPHGGKKDIRTFPFHGLLL